MIESLALRRRLAELSRSQLVFRKIGSIVGAATRRRNNPRLISGVSVD